MQDELALFQYIRDSSLNDRSFVSNSSSNFPITANIYLTKCLKEYLLRY